MLGTNGTNQDMASKLHQMEIYPVDSHIFQHCRIVMYCVMRNRIS